MVSDYKQELNVLKNVDLDEQKIYPITGIDMALALELDLGISQGVKNLTFINGSRIDTRGDSKTLDI